MERHEPIDPRRRDVLRGAAALAAAAAFTPVVRAETAPDLDEGAAFDAEVAGRPWLAPFKGVDDRDPARTDLRCDALVVTGRWPAGLRGRFYRNGPALFERAGQRYHHWFDGDGMVQQFVFDGHGVSHRGRMVRTPKLAAERRAGRFRLPAFGTTIRDPEPMQGPDAMNTANTNALEHAGRVLAMWEGGSAFALDPADLSTTGPVTWKAGYEQVPFSAHPKVDAAGHLWNIGTFADKIVVWHIDPAGALAGVQVAESPYPGGLAHDVAITAKHIVLPLPPVKMDYGAIARGATPEQAFRFEPNEPLRILVLRKDDIRERRVFELPAQMVFHVGNAFERPDGSIALSYVAAPDTEILVHGAVDLVSGRPSRGGRSALQSARLDLRTGRATVDALPGGVEFPRIDPRRIGIAARHVVSAAAWKDWPARGGLFHGVQVRDLQTGGVDRFDYGEQSVVEEHLLVPRPGGTAELDGWLVGTVYDARRKATVVNVLDARHVAAGPIAQAALPYGLPFGFHGNFSPA
jgi:carotenoid cleavage dioxygenase